MLQMSTVMNVTFRTSRTYKIFKHERIHWDGSIPSSISLPDVEVFLFPEMTGDICQAFASSKSLNKFVLLYFGVSFSQTKRSYDPKTGFII